MTCTSIATLVFVGCGDDPEEGDDLPMGEFTETDASTGTDPDAGPTTNDTTDTTDDTPGTETSADGSSSSGGPDDSTGDASTDSTDGTGTGTGTGTDSDDTTETTDDPTDPTGDPACDNGEADPDEVCFEEADAYDMGTSPADAAIGDFDNDGFLDIATSNSGSDDVSFRLNDDTGNFGAVGTVAAGDGADRLLSAELNGDDFDDLVVANLGTNTISVLLADGTGGFDAPVDITVGAGPSDLALANLNNATGIDIVVANSTDATFTALLNDGTGVFTPATGSPFSAVGGGPNPPAAAIFGIGVGSINGTPLDVFFCSATATGCFGAQGVLQGGGQYTFTLPAQAPFANVGTGLGRVIGGFNANADTDSDFAVVERTNDNLIIMIGEGGGNPTLARTAIGVGTNPSSAAFGDIDGDADVDLVVTNEGDDTITILLGNGAGVFTAHDVALSVGDAPSGVALADLNGDGAADIVVSNRGGASVSVLLSTL